MTTPSHQDPQATTPSAAWFDHRHQKRYAQIMRREITLQQALVAHEKDCATMADAIDHEIATTRLP